MKVSGNYIIELNEKEFNDIAGVLNASLTGDMYTPGDETVVELLQTDAFQAIVNPDGTNDVAAKVEE